MNHSTRLWAAFRQSLRPGTSRCGVCWGRLCPGPAARAGVLAQSSSPLLLPGCGGGHEAAGCRGLGRRARRGSVPLSALAAGPCCSVAEAPGTLPWVRRQQTWGFTDLSKAPCEHGCSAAGSSLDPAALARCVPPHRAPAQLPVGPDTPSTNTGSGTGERLLPPPPPADGAAPARAGGS